MSKFLIYGIFGLIGLTLISHGQTKAMFIVVGIVFLVALINRSGDGHMSL